eukprot:gene3605-2545_t
MEEMCLDYSQYCDLRALIAAEAERRENIVALWEDQANESAGFYATRGKAIAKRERDAARAAFLALQKERLAKIRPRELTMEEREHFTRWQLEIEENEAWERQLLVRQWELIGREVRRIFLGCIHHKYKFSFDLQNYAEVRELTARDLAPVRPVDRHLPQDLLTRLHRQREIAKVERERPFERLRALHPGVRCEGGGRGKACPLPREGGRRAGALSDVRTNVDQSSHSFSPQIISHTQYSIFRALILLNISNSEIILLPVVIFSGGGARAHLVRHWCTHRLSYYTPPLLLHTASLTTHRDPPAMRNHNFSDLRLQGSSLVFPISAVAESKPFLGGPTLDNLCSDNSVIQKNSSLEYADALGSADTRLMRRRRGSRIIRFHHGDTGSSGGPYSAFIANHTALRMDAQTFLFARSPNCSLVSNTGEEIHRLRSQRCPFPSAGPSGRGGGVVADQTSGLPVGHLSSFKSLPSHNGEARHGEEDVSLMGVMGDGAPVAPRCSSPRVISDSSALIKSLEPCQIISFGCGRNSLSHECADLDYLGDLSLSFPVQME